jgi:hypothetical protein
LIVVFICLSMFLSILNDNFRRERKNLIICFEKILTMDR